MKFNNTVRTGIVVLASALTFACGGDVFQKHYLARNVPSAQGFDVYIDRRDCNNGSITIGQYDTDNRNHHDSIHSDINEGRPFNTTLFAPVSSPLAKFTLADISRLYQQVCKDNEGKPSL